MNSYYITILIHLIVPFITAIPLVFRKAAPHKSNVFVYSKFMVCVGVCGVIVFDTLNVLLVFLSTDSLSDILWVTLAFQTFNFLPAYSVLVGLNVKVELNKEEMIYTNFLGISTKHNYNDTKKAVFYYFKNSKKVEKVVIYYKKARIVIDYYFVGFDEMVRILRKKINSNCVIIEKNKKLD